MLYTSLLSSAGATETSGRYGVRMRTETKAVRRIEPGAHTRQQGVWLLLLGGQCRLPVGHRRLQPNSWSQLSQCRWAEAIAGDAVVRVAGDVPRPAHECVARGHRKT